MLWRASSSKPRARRSLKSLVVLSRSSSFEGPTTSCPNTVFSLFIYLLPIILKRLVAVPVKYEQVVFCGLSDFQLALYRLFISSPEIKALLRGAQSQPLKAINILKKLCNHPELLNLPDDLQGCEALIPEGFVGAGGTGREKSRNQTVRCDWGGKFLVLERCVTELLQMGAFD